MEKRLIRNVVCLLLMVGLACGITGLYEQRDVIKQERTPHWVTFEGN